MQIAALVFDAITPLDIVGPIEVLARMPGAEIVIVGKQRGPVRDPRTHWTLTAEASLAEVPRPDLLVLPGGAGVRPLCAEEPILEWLRLAHGTTSWTTSVCTGSLLLGAAGLLRGLTATTHWASRELLERYGARYVEERVVQQGKIITSAGVSSGIDMALTLVAKMAGDDTAKGIQLSIEYDPQPPFNCGAPSKAEPAVLDRVRQAMQRAATAAR
jgi:transcriptional regulator GlxA family with amidase domain